MNRKRLLALGMALCVMLGTAGCGGDSGKAQPKGGDPAKAEQQKEEKAPEAVKLKIGAADVTAQMLSGFKLETADVFAMKNLAYYKGDVIAAGEQEKSLIAVKIDGTKAAVDKAMFKDGILAKDNRTLANPMVDASGNLYFTYGTVDIYYWNGSMQEARLSDTGYFAPGNTADWGVYYFAQNRFDRVAVNGGILGESKPWFITMNGGKKDMPTVGPFTKVKYVRVDKDTIYVLGLATEEVAKNCEVLAAYTLDGQEKFISGGRKKGDPDTLYMSSNFAVTDKYIMVPEKDQLKLFDKGTGAFVGGKEYAGILGNGQKISSIVAIDGQTVAVASRGPENKETKKYTFTLSTLKL